MRALDVIGEGGERERCRVDFGGGGVERGQRAIKRRRDRGGIEAAAGAGGGEGLFAAAAVVEAEALEDASEGGMGDDEVAEGGAGIGHGGGGGHAGEGDSPEYAPARRRRP